MLQDLRHLDDNQLARTAEKLIRSESRLQTCQIRVFAEMARRRLHLREGYDSLFTYLVKKYGQPKACAYQRSTIALVSERWPDLLAMIEERRLSLAAATVVAKHLNETNGQALLQACVGKTKEEVEMIVAGHSKTPVIRDIIRQLGSDQEPLILHQQAYRKRRERETLRKRALALPTLSICSRN